MKFKVGDRVKIKEDLSHRGSYKVGVTRNMERYKGKEATIVGLEYNDYSLDIDAGRYWWSEDTFEPIEKNKITESTFKVGDKVKLTNEKEAEMMRRCGFRLGNLYKIVQVLEKAVVVKNNQNRTYLADKNEVLKIENGFSKADLEFGDKVTYKNGSVKTVSGPFLIDHQGCAFLDYYDEELKCEENPDIDIVKVERPIKYETVYERTEEEKKEILDKVEREYLKAVIKPFRKKVEYIRKVRVFMSKEAYIEIATKDNDIVCLTCFDQDKTYKGMGLYKKYSLEELGL